MALLTLFSWKRKLLLLKLCRFFIFEPIEQKEKHLKIVTPKSYSIDVFVKNNLSIMYQCNKRKIM